MGRNLLGRIWNYPAAAVVALAVLVVGHNLTFLIQYGSDYAAHLARTGDGRSWDETARLVLFAAGFLATIAGLRMAFLLRQVRTTCPDVRVEMSGAEYARLVLPIWLRLFSAAIFLFVLQENYESWSATLPLPGVTVLGVVGLDSPILVFALVSLAFALVVALFRLSVGSLEALIAKARTPSWRRTSRPELPGEWDPESAPASVIGRKLAGRAPPALLAA